MFTTVSLSKLGNFLLLIVFTAHGIVNFLIISLAITSLTGSKTENLFLNLVPVFIKTFFH